MLLTAVSIGLSLAGATCLLRIMLEQRTSPPRARLGDDLRVVMSDYGLQCLPPDPSTRIYGTFHLRPGVTREEAERLRLTLNEARRATGIFPVHSPGLGNLVAVPGVRYKPMSPAPARAFNCRNCGAPPSSSATCEFCGTFYG
jgi:hypothetical protein